MSFLNYTLKSTSMEFNKAFASFCTHIDQYRHNLHEYNGHKLKSFRQNASTIEAYNLLQDFNSNEEITLVNLVEFLFKGFTEIYENIVEDTIEFYQDTTNYPIFTLMEFAIGEKFNIKNTVLNENQKALVKIYFDTVNDGFKKHNINIKNLSEKIVQASLIQEKENLQQFIASLVSQMKTELSDENKRMFSDLMNYNKKPDFESKFKHIINKVKNNWKSIIQLQDQMLRIQTCLDTSPLITHKSLNKECFPVPHFNKDKAFVTKYDNLITHFQKQLMQLSIDHLNEKITKLEADNSAIKERLIGEFDDLVYLKSTFNLNCTNTDEFFSEIKSQAEELVKTQLLEKDAKLKRLISKKAETSVEDNVNKDRNDPINERESENGNNFHSKGSKTILTKTKSLDNVSNVNKGSFHNRSNPKVTKKKPFDNVYVKQNNYNTKTFTDSINNNNNKNVQNNTNDFANNKTSQQQRFHPPQQQQNQALPQRQRFNNKNNVNSTANQNFQKRPGSKSKS